jgi:hypothetical protein
MPRLIRFPPPPFSKSLDDSELPEQPSGMAASGQRRQGGAGLSLAADDALITRSLEPIEGSPLSDLARVVEVWPCLAQDVRAAILTLADLAI